MEGGGQLLGEKSLDTRITIENDADLHGDRRVLETLGYMYVGFFFLQLLSVPPSQDFKSFPSNKHLYNNGEVSLRSISQRQRDKI